MPLGIRAFFYPYSLGTDLNECCRQLGDVPHVPAVWGGPLMSDAPRGVEYHGLLCFFRALVFRFFIFYKDPRMRIIAHNIAC